jgi:F0F1-type ATP synthase delta subunit
VSGYAEVAEGRRWAARGENLIARQTTSSNDAKEVKELCISKHMRLRNNFLRVMARNKKLNGRKLA